MMPHLPYDASAAAGADDDDVLLPEASGKAVITGAECTSSKLSYVLRGSKSCVAAANLNLSDQRFWRLAHLDGEETDSCSHDL